MSTGLCESISDEGMMLICVLQPTFSLTHSPWVPPPLAAGTISNATTRASSEAHKLHKFRKKISRVR